MAKIDWNPKDNEVAAPRNFDPIPKGRYLCQIDDTEMKPTKANDGGYLEVSLSVLAPKEFKGRKLWTRLNVNNKSEVAQRIGREQFNALAMAATGSVDVRDTNRLHMKKVVAHVSIERGGDQRDDQNRVNGFEAYAAPQPGTPTPSETKTTPALAPTTPAPQQPKADVLEDDDIPF